LGNSSVNQGRDNLLLITRRRIIRGKNWRCIRINKK